MLTTAQVRRRAFAEHVASGMSATQAYMRAGYKSTGHAAEASACTLLRNPEVQAIISAASEKASQVRVFDAAARREILRQIAEGEIEQEIETNTSGAMGATSTTQRRRPSDVARVAAIKHLDELDGLIIKKNEHSGPNGQPLGVLAAISEDAIRNRLAELAKRKPRP